MKRLGGNKSAMYAISLLVKNGGVVIVTIPKVRPDAEVMDVDIDADDTPDFAAEKILDELAKKGMITIETGDYSPEEEERVRKHLADLGYI